MTFIVTNTTIKPANVTWFTDTNADHFVSAGSHRQWVQTIPGLVSRTETDLDDANAKRVTLVFETEADYNNLVAERAKQDFWARRAAYNKANSIVTETTTTAG